SALSQPIKDEVGNFVSIAVTAHQISPHTEFWKLAIAIRSDLKRAIARKEPVVSLALLNKFLPRRIKPADLIKRIAKFNSRIMATNLGVISIPGRFGPIALDGFNLAISMTAFPENITAIIAIYHSQLEVTFCYSEPTLSRERITRLMEDVIDILERAASLPTTIPSVATDRKTRPKSLPVEVTVKG
ncbi:MAG TPA: hypothetical protein VEW46_10135, partial [Pyrinomonadaceae bacterium]|nr:hypothetical protein [Pyrinomonadaceae bacterium]